MEKYIGPVTDNLIDILTSKVSEEKTKLKKYGSIKYILKNNLPFFICLLLYPLIFFI